MNNNSRFMITVPRLIGHSPISSDHTLVVVRLAVALRGFTYIPANRAALPDSNDIIFRDRPGTNLLRHNTGEFLVPDQNLGAILVLRLIGHSSISSDHTLVVVRLPIALRGSTYIPANRAPLPDSNDIIFRDRMRANVLHHNTGEFLVPDHDLGEIIVLTILVVNTHFREVQVLGSAPGCWSYFGLWSYFDLMMVGILVGYFAAVMFCVEPTRIALISSSSTVHPTDQGRMENRNNQRKASWLQQRKATDDEGREQVARSEMHVIMTPSIRINRVPFSNDEYGCKVPPTRSSSRSESAEPPTVKKTTDLGPIFMPVAKRTALNARPSPSFNDKVTACRLCTEVEAMKMDWTLHKKYNVPKCRDILQCNVCVSYLKHLEDARANQRKKPGQSIEVDGMEDDEDSEDDQSSGEDEGSEQDDESDIGDSDMDCLFRLQDILGKHRVFRWDNPKNHTLQEAGGYAAATLLQAELQTKLDSLQISHGRVLNEHEHIGTELQLITAQRDQFQTQLEEAKTQLAAFQQVTAQSQTQLQEAKTHLAAALDEISRLRANDGELPHKRSKLNDTSETAPFPPAGRGSDPEWEILHAMKKPTGHASPEQIAQFIQFNEDTDFKGIPICGPNWVVDMRDVRGYKQVMTRTPSRVRGQPEQERVYHGKCLTRILSILAIPGKYELLLNENNAVIEAERFVPCNFGADPSALSDADVALLLAERGMGVAAAADAWQFCYNYVKAQVQNPDSFIVSDSMARILSILEASRASIESRSPGDPGQAKKDWPFEYVISAVLRVWSELIPSNTCGTFYNRLL
ncbi:hypothetical protein B0H13DRAFT_1896097 [Mycena leptocephala]|nr:hypothetical protein B0H13DRAFT_1896097 [Mycena leptocephala]